MTSYLDLLQTCSLRMRAEVLPLFRSEEAGVGSQIGAGGDIIKRIDSMAEKSLIDTLRENGTSCTLISEESGKIEIGGKPSEFYLAVDPIDGTTNALRGIPFVTISIALSKTPYLRDVEVALVSDIFHKATYVAERGKGASRNGEKIKPSSTSSLNEAVIGIDFNTFKLEKLASTLVPLLRETRHLRHLGANSLEICYVADGTTDAFLDLRGKLRVTDMAAASLILQEAKGIIVAPNGKELNGLLDPTQRLSFIAAGNLKLYNVMRKSLKLGPF